MNLWLVWKCGQDRMAVAAEMGNRMFVLDNIFLPSEA